MKPCELFPGAVIDWEGKPFITEAINIPFCGWNKGIVGLSGTDRITCFIEALQPLPISPAVLRGLGVEYEHGLGHWNYNDEFHVKIDNNPWYYIDPYMKVVESAHQLQALSLHLYGVELTWNQDEYEEAMKEERA